MDVSIKYYPKDAKTEKTILALFIRFSGNLLRFSTKQYIYNEAWNSEKQICVTSKELFKGKVNKQSKAVNKFIMELNSKLTAYFDEIYLSEMFPPKIKAGVQNIIDLMLFDKEEEVKKSTISATDFFESYVERKRIDNHTGRYISERTKIHQRTVIKRLRSFIRDCKLPDEFITFSGKKFDKQFCEWCYSTKNYKQNTIYATYGVLKPLLNAAVEEGYAVDDAYKKLKGKCTDTDAIYLTEEEIRKIYELDIPRLTSEGEIDNKSTIEHTRDLFIISCWTALRRSDINQLNKAIFDVDNKTILITAEKTKKPVVIPMHPMVYNIWQKYNGRFPHLADKSSTNKHLRECARLAGIDSQVRIVENRGGEAITLTYKKYQLVGMHTGRRSFATNMYLRRFPTIAIMKLTGHTTETNFLKYIKVTPEENAALFSEEFFKCSKPFEKD